jgi:hypothetical protein
MKLISSQQHLFYVFSVNCITRAKCFDRACLSSGPILHKSQNCTIAFDLLTWILRYFLAHRVKLNICNFYGDESLKMTRIGRNMLSE